MTDVSKDRKGWRHIKSVAEQRLAGLGGVLEWSTVAYEVMRWESQNLVLIFYPHRTSAGNYHIRIRKGRCNDRTLLRKCILAIAENSCNFQFPTERALHDEGVSVALDQKRPFSG